MQDVKIWDAKGAVLDVKEISMTELPPIPDWFQEALTEAGGTTSDGRPNIRVVSGLDPELKEFYGDRWWLKYATRENNRHDYVVWHKPDGSKKILTPAEYKTLQDMTKRGKKIQGILLPVVDHQIVEYGIPRYFVEYYKPPQAFGDPAEWEEQRWFKHPDTEEVIDLMGEFPSEGLYDTWFSIEEPVVDASGVVVQTKFRLLDEVVLEYIKLKIEQAKVTSAAKRHEQLRQEVDEEYEERREELKAEIRDIITDRIDDILD